jgi:hypothetical protein
MKRKILTILLVIATTMAPLATEAQERSAVGRQSQLQTVILRVRTAFENRASCRNLFSKYGSDPRRTLDRANFVFVGDALKPLGFAAATAVRTNQTFVGTGFYRNAGDVDGMATVLIHELLHQQGAGPEIDDYAKNYEQIANACGTRNAAK